MWCVSHWRQVAVKWNCFLMIIGPWKVMCMERMFAASTSQWVHCLLCVMVRGAFAACWVMGFHGCGVMRCWCRRTGWLCYFRSFILWCFFFVAGNANTRTAFHENLFFIQIITYRLKVFQHSTALFMARFWFRVFNVMIHVSGSMKP